MELVKQYDSLTNTNNGIHLASNLVSALWKALIDKWKQRCEKEHETNKQNIIQSILPWIKKLIIATPCSHKLTMWSNQEVFNTQIDDLKSLSIKRKTITVSRLTIICNLQASLKRAIVRLKHQNRPITHFFRPIDRPPQPTKTSLQPITNARTCAAEYDPPWRHTYTWLQSNRGKTIILGI